MSYYVKNYMRKEFLTVEENVLVSEAANKMKVSRIGFMIVLKNGKPEGIVTERDFVYKVLSKGLDAKKILIEEIMSSPLLTADPDEDLLKAAELMHKNNIRRLPVVRDGIIYGVLTSWDISLHCIDYVNKSTKDILRWATPFRV